MKNRGITLISLILIVIIMIILITFGIKYAEMELQKEKLEDLVTKMLLIEGKTEVIIDKKSFEDEEAQYIGTLIDNISDFTYLPNEEGHLYYKITNDNITELGLTGVNIEPNEFYIVDYETGEIYYSKGFTKDEKTYYSLTELKELN